MDLDLSILKAICNDKTCALEFSHEGSEKLFTTDYWFFGKSVVDYIKTYKNVPTKRVLLEKLTKGKKDPKFAIIDSIWDQIEKVNYDTKEFKHDLEKLKNRYACNSINEIADKLVSCNGVFDVKNTISDLTTKVQNIKGLYTTKKYDQKTLKEGLQGFRDKYNAKKSDPEFTEGVKIGYGFLDFTLGSLRGGEMLAFGGASGSGKSMLLLNVAVQMWMQQNTLYTEAPFKKGNNVVYFSLEMPYEDCMERVLSRIAMVNQKRVRDACLNDEEIAKMKLATSFIERYPYELEIIDIPRGATAASIELIYNEVKAKYNPDVIIIDYLGLMKSENSDEDDWKALGTISEATHEISRVYNIPIITALQLTDLKRNGKNSADMQIGGHRIGRSSMILHNLSFFIMIETRQNEEQFPDMLLHMVKSRRTELCVGSLNKHFECCAILDNIGAPAEEISDISDRIANLK